MWNLADSLLRVWTALAPSELTADTVLKTRQLVAHLKLVPTNSEWTAGSAIDSASARHLIEQWEREGGDSRDLETFLTLYQYRQRVIYNWHGPNGQQIDEFWTASGRDLHDLSEFLADVDDEAADWMPK